LNRFSPAARSTTGCSTAIETLSGEVGRPCHLGLGVAPVCLDRHRLARLGDRQGACEFGGQHGRLPDMSRDQHVLGFERERRRFDLNSAAASAQRSSMPKGKPPIVCVAQV
jgi:hypothetical protein